MTPIRKHSLFPTRRFDQYRVAIQSRCPHCGQINYHEVRHFYRIFKCVDGRCDRCQNHYYIIPPQGQYPETKCELCEERVECLINGSTLALYWREGYEEPDDWRQYQFPHPDRWIKR